MYTFTCASNINSDTNIATNIATANETDLWSVKLPTPTINHITLKQDGQLPVYVHYYALDVIQC